MIKVYIAWGTSSADLQDTVNDWLERNGPNVSIIRIGDVVAKTGGSGCYLTIVYSTNPDKMFSQI